MLERFTTSARQTVMGARDEAIATGRTYVGTEHMLIALLDVDRGPAYQVLTEAGVTAASVRADLDRRIPPAADPLGPGDAEALRAIGIDLDAVIARVEAAFGEGALDEPDESRGERRRLFGRGRREPMGTRRRPRITPRAKKVLELALREAIYRNDHEIRAEHILLGLIREGDGLAAQILTEAGLSLADLRTRLDKTLGDAA
ncbi:MAG TPA: Clp protease N-terminal domain-containing protein [Micromonosporaceae bacterium]|jgi:ATP-dependent Clp protease ATP-binding subunit ClpA|nr:Clp protease N-terminal domain-containing protein [Micromonosporaceae bacterium]